MTNEQKQQTDDVRARLKLLSLRPEHRNGHRKEVEPDFEEQIIELRAEIKRKANGF